MPKASKETAADAVARPGFTARYESLEGGYTVGFETFTEDSDVTPLLKGLPEDRCPSPHWGYVFKGKLTYMYEGDREDIIEAGEAFYAPAGHTLTAAAGTELVFFSPTPEWKQMVDAVTANQDRAAVFA